MCDTASSIPSFSTSGVKSIGFPGIEFSLVYIEIKEKLNVEYPEMDTTLMKET